jgi:hypothetical protein
MEAMQATCDFKEKIYLDLKDLDQSRWQGGGPGGRGGIIGAPWMS